MDKEIENTEVVSKLKMHYLSRNYFNWAFEHPNKTNPTMTALFFFLVEVSARMRWTDNLSITSKECMEAIGMGSYSTFKKHFYSLVNNGFIKLRDISNNRYQINIITLTHDMEYLDENRRNDSHQAFENTNRRTENKRK